MLYSRYRRFNMIRKFALSLGVLFFVGTASLFLFSQKAYAAFCDGTTGTLAYGREERCGFFFNGHFYVGTGGPLFPNGIYPSGSGMTRVSNFKQIVIDRLQTGGDGQKAASFLILTMIGELSDRSLISAGSYSSDSRYQKWSSLVDQYEAAGRINWNYSLDWHCGQINTLIGDTTAGRDVVPYITTETNAISPNCYSSGEAAVWVDAIVFTSPGGGRYVIKKSCGNPIGSPTPLKELDVCNNLPGMQATVPSGYVQISTGVCDRPPNINSPTGSCTTGTFTVKASDPDYSGPLKVELWSGSPPPGSGSLIATVLTSSGMSTFVLPTGSMARAKLITTGGLYSFRVTGRVPGTGANGLTASTNINMPSCNKSACDFSSNTFTANSMTIGLPFTFTVGLQLDAWTSPPYTVGTTPKMDIQLRDPAGNIVPLAPAYSVSGLMPAKLQAKSTFTPKLAGVYQMTWGSTGIVNGSNLGVNCSVDTDGDGDGDGPPFTNTAMYQPFFTVTNGDIFSPGDIISWNGNNNPDSGIGYNGAGTNLAALASGSIQHFVTGTSLTSPGDRTGLAFANTTSANPTYGGGYPVIAYSPLSGSVATASPGTLDLSTLTSGVYTYNGDLTISGQLQPGVGVTIHLESGNLYIASPGVTYASYTAPNEIPRLSVYVKAGNIYVDNDVSEIRGMYYAGGTGKGNFYSCASGMGVPIDLATSPTGYDDCNKKLTIYGAVAANNLILLRTWGNLGAFYTPDPVHPSESAEEFVYSPELWMVPDATTKTGPVKFDLYTSLAPVL